MTLSEPASAATVPAIRRFPATSDACGHRPLPASLARDGLW